MLLVFKAGELGKMVCMLMFPVGGAVESLQVWQMPGVFQKHGPDARVRSGAVGLGQRQRVIGGGVLSETHAQLLKIEAAFGLIHLDAAAMDRGQERQHAGQQDRRGHGDVCPAKRDSHRDELADRPPASNLVHAGKGRFEQARGRVEVVGRTVVQVQVNVLDKQIQPMRKRGVGGGLRLDSRFLAGVQLSKGVIEHF